MVDERTQELISGYLDGALSSEELTTVQRQLAESVECREFLDQLQRQQSLLRAVPRRRVKVDLKQRVLAEVERQRPQPSRAPSGGETVAPSRLTFGWRKMALAVAGIAAVLLAMVYVQNRPTGSGNAVAIPAPTPITPARPVELPEVTLAAIQDFRQMVKMCLVYDITVTPEGQRDGVVEKWLLAAGIPKGEAVPVDDHLEKKLRDSSLAPAPVVQAAAGKVARDRVEMMLIRGTSRHIDSFFHQYQLIREQPVRPADITMNVVFADREIQVMMQLNMVQGVDLAELRSDRELLKQPLAIPLQFANPLQSLPVAAKKPAVNLVVRRTERLVAQAVPPVEPVKERGTGWDDPSQALLIIRNQLP